MGAGRLTGRILVAAVAACLAVSVHAAAAAAGGFFVGVDEGQAEWANPQLTTSVAAALGVQAVRIPVPWTPGETAPSATESQQLAALIRAAWGLRVVLPVSGAPAAAP